MELLLGTTEVRFHYTLLDFFISLRFLVMMRFTLLRYFTVFNSVTWMIEDLLLEYASQIEQQMNRLVNVIEQHHWRTNPAVLAGMRVAVFRKGSNPLPTIVTG